MPDLLTEVEVLLRLLAAEKNNNGFIIYRRYSPEVQ